MSARPTTGIDWRPVPGVTLTDTMEAAPYCTGVRPEPCDGVWYWRVAP